MKSPYRLLLVWVLVIGMFAVAGCSTRSISDSGYSGRWGRSMYSGELHEFNVLGIAPDAGVSDEAIAAAMEQRGSFTIPRGSRILLIQSGAPMPDEPMQRGLERYYGVTPFSGNTVHDDPEANYAKGLRMAAARGGCEFIVCYWGVLETGQSNLATKAISWVPIAGYAVPDETQHMRIRLRVVGVDVRTGTWAMITPESYNDTAWSARANRRASDQAQVETLKEQAYGAAAEAVIAAWGG